MLDPELKPFLAVWDAKWAELAPGAGPKERREHFEVIAAAMRLPTPDDVETDREVWIETPVGPVRVRTFRHKSGGVQPCLIYMHGGAWMQGSPETHWDITSRIASRNRQTVISVDYALAPEHPFPQAVEQCTAVAAWASANASTLGIDATRLSIGGDSAGANLAAAIAIRLRGSKVKLSAQLLIYPPVAFDKSRPSYTENAEGPLLKTAGMDLVNALYCPYPEDLKNPLAAPILAGDHRGLPPVFIAVAEHDPLRDDGIDYAEVLREAGVPVVLDFGEGLIHGYLRSMEYCRQAALKLETMSDWLAAQNAAG